MNTNTVMKRIRNDLVQLRYEVDSMRVNTDSPVTYDRLGKVQDKLWDATQAVWDALELLEQVEPHDFLDDDEKMYDFYKMSKEDFLEFYSYLTEEEYNLTEENLKKLYK